MLSVSEARNRIISDMKLTAAVQVSVGDIFGRVLAQKLKSRRTQPPFDASAMDGYAVRAEDITSVPSTLQVVGSVNAGTRYNAKIKAGQAVRIFTGAPIPEGTNTVIIQEDTEVDGNTLTIKGIEPKRHIRKAGLDFNKGETIFEAGKFITARDAGLIAAMNYPWVMVRQRPRVGILSTGDEVVMPGDPVGPNQIVSANSIGLAAAVRAFGGDPVLLGNAPDDHNALSKIAEGARGIDLLVTTGGASVGDHDLIREVLGDVGLNVNFWKIAMRPGKPLIFGDFNGIPLLGLPGNPVSSMVCALIFLKPALEAQLGLAESEDDLETAIISEALNKNGYREDFVRASSTKAQDGIIRVKPFPIQDSSMMLLLAQSNCFIVREPEAPAVQAGSPVRILRMPTRRPSF